MRRFESSYPSHLLMKYSLSASNSNSEPTEKVLAVSRMMVFTGNANPELAQKVVERLDIPMGKAVVGRFSDGEVNVEIQENVRGKDVFIIQSTCAPTNDNLMELIVLADALRRASASRVTAVVPYFGYARQDRRPRSARVAISARVVADMISAVGIDRVLTVDLHADQIQGFFDSPVDNVYGSPVLLDDIVDQQYDNIMVVSPDVGGVVRARAIAKQLDCDLAIIDKRRERANESQVMNIIGDVEGRTCILVDDMCDTAGTLCKAAKALKDNGAAKVYAYATHPVLSGPAMQNLNNSELDELVVTDTIPLSKAAQECPKVRQLTLAPMLAEAVRRVCNEESISAMFR
jgi:ribose-phosphate pyrophosphokinase